MSAHVRADLATLAGYVPGRSVEGAVKLASNEVSAPPPISVQAAIAEAAMAGNRYPDFAAQALRGRLAALADVPEERVAVGCGSVSLCQQLVQATAVAGEEVLFAWRSFEAFPIITRIAGATPRPVALDGHHGHDLDAMAAAIIPATRLVFVCNPNNPTGTAVRRAELVRFLDAMPPDVVVALDEAYREFVTDPDVPDGLELAAERDNLVVLRTFSKAYRLAGLRVGWCVGSPEVVAAVRQVYVPFSVSTVAQAAALAALDVADELLDDCAAIAEERERVRGELCDADYDVPGSQANFLWLPLGTTTMAFAEYCLEHKVVVRPFAGEGVRVTVGSVAENEVFLAAARSFPGIRR